MNLYKYLIGVVWLCFIMHAGDSADDRNHPAVRAFLDVIACLEGTYNAGYNIKFGGTPFSGYDDHPRQPVTITVRGHAKTSTAAGRYQLTSEEWDVLKEQTQAPSFGPRYQDHAMIALLDKAGVLADVKKLDFDRSLENLAPYKPSVAKFLSGSIRRCSRESLYATFIARYRSYTQFSVSDVLESYYNEPQVKAFLDMIAFAEGTYSEGGYTRCFTGKQCTLSWHPEKVICARSGGRTLCSSAAGRYQFLKDAWNIVAWRIGARDFSFKEQDRAAILVLLDMGVIQALLQDDLSTAIQRANGKWASLPGAKYHQPTCSFEDVSRVFYQRYAYYQNN